MPSYSMIKIGNDYIVQADDKHILKVASRRRAAQLISEAMGLLKAEAALSAETEHEAPSHRGEPPDVS